MGWISGVNNDVRICADNMCPRDSCCLIFTLKTESVCLFACSFVVVDIKLWKSGDGQRLSSKMGDARSGIRTHAPKDWILIPAR